MKTNGIKIFVGCVIIVIASAVVTGLIMAGSPAAERSRRLDQQRVSDLQQLTSSIDQYYNGHSYTLPPTLQDMRNDRQVYVGSTQDPDTGAPYAYSLTSTSTYSLCAAFETTLQNSQTNPPQMYPQGAPTPMMAYGMMGSDFWNHPSGMKCYTDLKPQTFAKPTT